jgi:GPH family glycoside/pentoside/hexuronide:cation symporter
MNVKLTTKTKVLYGVADLGISLLTAAIQFFLLFFYTDIAGIDPGLAGTALLVGKLTWDAINDPFFGFLSDRTRSRWGRRKPYMLLGAIPFGLTICCCSHFRRVWWVSSISCRAGFFPAGVTFKPWSACPTMPFRLTDLRL